MAKSTTPAAPAETNTLVTPEHPKGLSAAEMKKMNDEMEQQQAVYRSQALAAHLYPTILQHTLAQSNTAEITDDIVIAAAKKSQHIASLAIKNMV